jgi:uncharacterized protein
MRAIVTGMLLAACVSAATYPQQNGFVNDFANQLPLEAVQSLEKKVRDYQRATGVQIGVAVVPSLEGMSIAEYSQGLFRAWGVGQYGINNGVLFVWAPKQRQIRIHMGTGLESRLPKPETDRIIGGVRDLFRAGRYEDGVNAAIDGVIQVLGAGAESAPPANATPPPPEEASGDNTALIGLAVVAAVCVGLWLLYRRSRSARWTEEIPRQLAEADTSLQDADRKRAAAAVALAELRREAPDDVWRPFEVAVAATPDAIQQLRTDLDNIRLMPRRDYSSLKAAHRAMRHWQYRMESTLSSLDQARQTLDTFRMRREEAQRMLDALPSKITRMEADGVPNRAEGLLRAAAETFGQALDASRQLPVNWLFVYDLLADVSACLEQIENPSRTRYRPTRYWAGDVDSPAFNALDMLYLSEMQSSGGGSGFDAGSSGGSFDSGSGGGGGFDSGGSFGGGDSGGGGSSSDY